MASAPALYKTVDLKPAQELRLECAAGTPVSLRLEDGTAEVFGTELHLGQPVSVTGQKLAVFTWEGCKVSILGEPAVWYVADETPMAQYLNVHQTLNARRQEAQKAGNSLGPCCIVAGPTDSGKSTLCRMLCSWAVRSGWQPTFVDLDVGQGTITVPGCISAVPVDSPIDVEEGYSADIPLVFFFGHASPGENPTLFKHLVDKLAALLQRRAQANSLAGCSGLVINTFGWVDGQGYEMLKHAIQAFAADVVLVLEQDRLHAQLQHDLRAAGGSSTSTSKPPSIIKLAKSGGAVTRQADERRAAREHRIRDYFYGAGGGLQPSANTVQAERLVVYRIGTGPRAPNSALPIGAVSLADPLRLTNLPVNSELVQCLVAVSHAQTPDQIPNTNVAGFLLVKDVDTARGLVTFMAPAPGALPGRYLVMGSLRSSLD